MKRNLKLKLLLASSLLLAGPVAFAEPCFGPGGCGVETSGPTGPCFGPGGCGAVTPPPPAVPDGPCFGDYGCSTAEQTMLGPYGVVILTLPDGYAQAGIAGPCRYWPCPDLMNQAQADAELRLKHALRYQRYRDE